MNFDEYTKILDGANLTTEYGRIDKIVSMTLESIGPESNIGDICTIETTDGKREILAEVVGIDGVRISLMPYVDTDGIGYGSKVFNTHQKLMIACSNDLIGRVVDAVGNPLDGKSPIKAKEKMPINGAPPNPMTRPRIDTVMELGVRAIDGLMTFGKGQRMGIFAGSGVGKSTLLGMIARNVKADVNVIALVGERGREVVEFMERDLGEEGLKRSVLVIATSDQPAMMRLKCPLTATAIAEYFAAQGKDVLLMMDSLTRFAMAQREVGLSTGEAPIARGYTPSIYTSLPKLLERAGKFETGSITGLYTVLVEGDDANEPISDTVRSIIDGHIMLSRKLAMKNQYPAIDVLASLSRLMNDIVSDEHKEVANKLRNLLSVYTSNQDLILIGAYKSGSNPELDEAISKINAINNFLKQRVDEKSTMEETIAALKGLFN